MAFIRTTVMAMSVLILVLSIASVEVIAGESIPDWELATLYGGWEWFYNPYCGVPLNGCDEHTECNAWEKCRFCAVTVGLKCFDARSWLPDLDGCDDGTKPCENASGPNFGIPEIYGFCSMVMCIEEYKQPGHFYPDCDVDNYDWCDD